ncbi:MAG TPA: hypothetical protein VFY91_04470 [Microbacterium sp.]|nr:hypothetical protein [Microbacterium sp.]
MTDAKMRFCRSRNAGRRCTRELGHLGLHRHRALLWSDAGADPADCPASGEPAAPAATLSNGFPGGRALCERCHEFVELREGRLADHRTSSPETDDENRRQWFNSHGW